jgi:hypothetical protein
MSGVCTMLTCPPDVQPLLHLLTVGHKSSKRQTLIRTVA